MVTPKATTTAANSNGFVIYWIRVNLHFAALLPVLHSCCYLADVLLQPYVSRDSIDS